MRNHLTPQGGVDKRIYLMKNKCLLIFVFLGIAPALSFAAINTKKPVPEKEIKEFVTAIQAIQHYYIKPVKDKKLLMNAIRGMVSHLDPHSGFLDSKALKEIDTTVSGEFVGVGIELTNSKHGFLKVISPLDGSPAAIAGVKPGDLIIKIDNKLVQNMSLNKAVSQIKGKRGTKVKLTILRKKSDKPLHLTLTRDVIKIESVKSKMPLPHFGYVRISFFQGPVEKLVKKAITKLKKESKGNLKGLVLDLRDDPGGLLDVSADVVDLFLNKNDVKRHDGLIVYTKGRLPESDITYKADPKNVIANVPMVVLINSGSASASEIVAGALQDYKRAIIMGTRSFGKGSVQTIVPISDDSALKITTALYYTPAGREIQAHGIEPNIVVPELNVDKKKMDHLLKIDESAYNGHIINGNGKKDSDKKAKLAMQKKLLAVAKKDYQLYQALVMLKGMHAIR